jgi:C1A family cysteine protease
VRAALQVLRTQGQPLTGKPASAPRFRIASYWAVPFTQDAIKRALTQFGPVWIAIRFDRAWYRPMAGVMPAPSGVVEGGHALYVFGYDASVGPGGSALIRNSWGRSWGHNGNAYFPWSYLVPALHDAWSTADMKETP